MWTGYSACPGKFKLSGTPFVMAVLGCQLHLELGKTQAAEHTCEG